MRAQLQHTWTLSKGEWALAILELSGKVVVSSSAGKLYYYDTSSPQSEPLVVTAHESSINAIAKVDTTRVASCSGDGVKIWNVNSPQNPEKTFSGAKNSTFLSLACCNNLLAAGTELAGQDAELHVWELSKDTSDPVRSFIDSHHDDITYLEFHPSMPQYLMSGSTDGYVNIYDLTQDDEDEALHQVINFASVHSCQFTQERRIAVLTHMETLGYFELNDQDYENAQEPQPSLIGDVRAVWPDCEYVIKLGPEKGFVAYGANSQRKLTLLPFDPATEQVDLSQPCWFPGAHDEEVVRDIVALSSNLVLTCGEDGAIRSWLLPWNLKERIVTQHDAPEHIEKKPRKEKKEKKDKKDKKDKKEKKDKKHKKKKDVKFKPY